MISTVEKVLFLKSVDLFRQIPGDDLVRVAEIAEQISFNKGDELVVEGEPGESMYLLVAGKVEIIVGGEVLVEFGEKECVGELAILDSEPRSATVRCKEPVAALKIEREEFYELMIEKTEIAIGMIKVLTRRIREMTTKTSRANSQPG
ncbi:MAG: cyclic nucleotide-binding domain-containing protein [Myxococcota bacterium]|nr:cyclic nucleotide-binding domain-containing protein [Myxococcota bacterium]